MSMPNTARNTVISARISLSAAIPENVILECQLDAPIVIMMGGPSGCLKKHSADKDFVMKPGVL